jgi:hypothetical protein
MVKAMIEPMTMPQTPPSAIPSRNIRFRKNVIFVTFSMLIYCRYTTVLASLQRRSS